MVVSSSPQIAHVQKAGVLDGDNGTCKFSHKKKHVDARRKFIKDHPEIFKARKKPPKDDGDAGPSLSQPQSEDDVQQDADDLQDDDDITDTSGSDDDGQE